ncbi:MAG: Crp/Fnr family transcriptional regulator [Brotaphodocola sp.]
MTRTDFVSRIKITPAVPKDEDFSYFLTLPRGSSRLDKLGEPISFPKNHVIVKAGQRTQYCYILKKGRVITYEYLPSGEERIYYFQGKNSLFLESNLLFDRVVSVGFRTTCPTEVIRIDKPTLLTSMNTNSELALDIMESISVKFFASMEQLRQFKNHNTLWNICGLFLVFAQHYGVLYDGKILITEKISQQLLSSMLGVNRITAVRSIKELKDLGLIEQINGYYCIRDIERLKKYQNSIDK